MPVLRRAQSRRPASLVAFAEVDAESRTGPVCKPGFKCPIVDGQCCANQESCCPQRCVKVGVTTYECRQTEDEERQRDLYEAFLRKRELDKREDELARQEKDAEQKALDEIKHKQEIAAWEEEKARDAAARKAVWNRKIAGLRSRLAALAKHLGVPVESLLSQDAALFHPGKPGPANDPEVPYEDRTSCGLLPSSPCKVSSVFAPAGDPFDGPRIEKWEPRDVCFLSGAVQGPVMKGEAGSELLRITPTSNCIPEGGSIMFPAFYGDNIAVLELDSKGKVTLKDFVGREQEGKPVVTFSVAYSVKNGSTVMIGKRANWNDPWPAATERTPYLTNIGDLCMLSGRVHQSATAKVVNWNAPAADLVKMCVPAFDRIFIVVGEGEDAITKKHAQLTIQMNEFRNNSIVPVPQKTSLIHISTSFDGMVWSTAKGTQLTLSPEGGWEVDANPTSPTEATFTRIGSVVMLNGRIKEGKSSLIGELPPNFRPFKGTHVFPVAADGGVARIEVSASGRISCPNYQGKKWISLDGVVFAAARTDKEALDVEENDIDVVEAKRRGISAPELRPTGSNQSPASAGVEEAKRTATLQEAGQVVQELKQELKNKPTSS